MKLRAYQSAAVQAVFSYFQAGNTGHPLIVAPTGSGKSHILAGILARVHNKYPNEQILIVTHTREIIRQNLKIAKQYIPREKCGVYSAGLHKRQVAPYTFASIQSIYKKAELFKEHKLIIVDEAHLIPPSGEGRYRTLFEKLPTSRVLGLTATPFRRAHGMLTDNHMFDRIIYDIKIQELIDKGYLASLTTKATEYVMDVAGLKLLGGDYSKADLSRRLDHTQVTNSIIKELIKFEQARKAWLIFAIDIAHCEHITAELNKHGIVAAAVHSKLDFDRQQLLDLFKAGHIQALVSVETLTTGFDAPNVDMLALLRPTASPVLHVQMLGRGMRVFEGKDKCLVLDFAGNVSRLGPVDMVEVKPKLTKKGKGKGITRTCPECSEIVHISKKACPECGYVFPVKSKLTTVISDAAVLASQLKYNIVYKDVQFVRYSKHRKPGRLPTLKVSYVCGPLNIYNEWIAFEHNGYPKQKATQWWRQHAQTNIPATVDEAIQRQVELTAPKQVIVRFAQGKYPEIIGYK